MSDMEEEEYHSPNREDRIKIANEMLSALLLQGAEDPLNNPGVQPEDVEVDEDGKRKVYVDWPDDDDETQYRFVSSRVEDYPEETERPSPEPYDSLDMNVSAPQPLATQPVRRIIPLSTPPVTYQPAPVKGSTVTPMPEPVRYTGHTIHPADEEEQELLREEYMYQNALKQRLQQNQIIDEDLVPPLNLTDLEQSEDFRNQSEMMEISVRSPEPQPVHGVVISQKKMPAGVGKLSDYVDSLDAEDRWEEKAPDDEKRRNPAVEESSNGLPYNHRVEFSTEVDTRARGNDSNQVDSERYEQARDTRNGHIPNRGVQTESQHSVRSHHSVHTRSLPKMHSDSQSQIRSQSYAQSQYSTHTQSQHSGYAQSRHNVHNQPQQHEGYAQAHPIGYQTQHSRHDQSHHSVHDQPYTQSKHNVHTSPQHNAHDHNYTQSKHNVHTSPQHTGPSHRHTDDGGVLESPVVSKPPQSPYYQRRDSQRSRIPQPSPKRSNPRSREASPRRSPHRQHQPQPPYYEDSTIARIPQEGTYERYPSEQAYPDSRQTYPRHQRYPYSDEQENQYYDKQAKSRSRLAERIEVAEQRAYHDQRYPTQDQYYYPEHHDNPGRYQQRDRTQDLVRGRPDESRLSHNRILQAEMELQSEYESQRARRFSESSIPTSIRNTNVHPAQKIRQSHRSLDDIPGSARRATRKPEITGTNFVQKNKQTYGKNTTNSGYKTIYAKKQEVYQHQASSAPGRLPSRKPPLPGIKSRVREDSWEEPEAVGAERLWAQRSKALHHHSNPSPKKRRNFTASNPDLRSMEPEPSVMKRIDSHPASLHQSSEPQRVSIDLNVKITPQGFQFAQNEGEKIWPAREEDQFSVVQEEPSEYIRPYADPYILDKAFKSPRDLSLQERTPSNLDKLVYSHTATNPFTPLPPIKHDLSDDEPEPPVTNGYLAQYKKDQDVKKGSAPRHYKPYSLNDYKQMQKEVKLGGLGPDRDSDAYKEKMARRQKAEEYARQINEKIAQEKEQAQKAGRPRKVAPPQRDVFSPSIVLSTSRRKAAMEYAKKLQRPNSKTKPKDTANTPKDAPKNANNIKPGLKKTKKSETETIDLKRLLERHERDKENVAAVRAQMMEA